jgi:hypothetical protein
MIVPITPVLSIRNPSTGLPFLEISSKILFVHFGSIPIKITSETIWFFQVQINVLNGKSKSETN